MKAMVSFLSDDILGSTFAAAAQQPWATAASAGACYTRSSNAESSLPSLDSVQRLSCHILRLDQSGVGGSLVRGEIVSQRGGQIRVCLLLFRCLDSNNKNQHLRRWAFRGITDSFIHTLVVVALAVLTPDMQRSDGALGVQGAPIQGFWGSKRHGL